MNQIIGSAVEIQVVDLVLDPFGYHDALSARASEGRLESGTIDHLARVLPVAAAQLDAIGDAYGTMALTKLYDQLTQPETVA